MKHITKLIENLQKVKETHGDLPIIYAADDEGNHFDYTKMGPTPMLYKNNEAYNIDQEEINKNEYTLVCCIN